MGVALEEVEVWAQEEEEVVLSNVDHAEGFDRLYHVVVVGEMGLGVGQVA